MPFPVFAVGELVTSADQNRIGMWLVLTQTIGAGVGTVVVPNAFSSNFENYKITVTDMSLSATARIRMTLNGTVGQGFRHGGWRSSYTAAVLDSEQGNNVFSWPIALGGAGNMGISTEVYSPQLAKRTQYQSTSGAVDFSFFQAGIETSNSVHTGFSLVADAPTTMTGGVIRVYGLRN